MKYLIVRCEDVAVSGTSEGEGLLEVAKLSCLQALAQAGAVGVMTTPKDGGWWWGRHREPWNGLPAHWRWLGYAASDVSETSADQRNGCSWEAGRCYAASRHLQVEDQDVAWCCELMTQHEGRVSDITAGRIPTNQAASLLDALNTQVGTSAVRWVVGENSHHVLVLRKPEWAATQTCASLATPEQLMGQPWRSRLPREGMGMRIRRLLESALPLLERHEVNKVRVDLGENPANMMWLWGPSAARPIAPFHAKHGVSGAIMAPAFPLQGLAQVVGLAWEEGIHRPQEADLRRVLRELPAMLTKHRLVYLPIRIDQTDRIERQCAVERIDQHFIKPLIDQMLRARDVRCVVAVDDRRTRTSPFVAIGGDLPPHPALRLTAETEGRSALVFRDGAMFFQWFMESGSPR